MYIYFLSFLFICPLLAETPPSKSESFIGENPYGIKEELTVSEIHNEKKKNEKKKNIFITTLVLSDGSQWEVKPEDAYTAQSWFIPHAMKIEASNDPAYPYKITNQVTGSFVLVKKKNSQS